MNKQTEREVARLNKLADYIEQNPNKFALMDSRNCIIGLGLKLARNKTRGEANDRKEFARIMGLDFEVVTSLYVGMFNEINPRAKEFSCESEKIGHRQTVSILRWVANRKAEGKIIKYYGD